MSVEQYWMGKDLDLDSLWQDFDASACCGPHAAVRLPLSKWF